MDRSRYNAVDSSNRQYGERGRQYGERSRQYGERNRQYGERSRQYGERSRQYGERSRQYGENNRQYGENNRQYGENNNCQQHKTGGSYLFPVVTVMAVVLLAVSTFVYRSVIGAFAADSGSYFVEIFSSQGEYSVTVTGDQSTTIDLPDSQVEKKVNEEAKTVTFTVKLTEERKTTISSDKALSTITFGENASAIKGIYANSSKVASIDISHCENLETLLIKDTLVKELNIDGLQKLYYINAINTPFATFAKAYALNFARPDGCSISINPPEYRKDDDGIYFNVTDIGDNDVLSLMINGDSNYSSCIEYKDGNYYISNSALSEAYKNKGSLYLEIRNTQEKLFFAILIDIPDSVITGSDKKSPSNVDQKKDDNVKNDTDKAKADEGEAKNDTDKATADADQEKKEENITVIVPRYDDAKADTGETKNNTDEAKADTNEAQNAAKVQVNPQNEPINQNDDNVANLELAVEKNSKNVIKSAYIENVDSIDAKSLQIVAKTLSAANKKAFLAAIKNVDKDFNDSDPNLIVYNFYVADSKGNEVSVKDKAAVTVNLAYPSDAVRFMYNEYDYKVYHQLSDNTIDTSIAAYGEKDAIQFTTDSFSNFAISCSKDESDYAYIPVASNSSNIIKSAKAHSDTKFLIDDVEYDVDSLEIVATALSANDKKAFIEQIKKVDKSFKEDSNLMIYDVKILNEDGDEVKIQGKVDFTLAYPNDNLSKNYGKYIYKVYHQKTSDSIDTNPVAVGGKDGVTVTTDSLSAFAVAPNAKSGGNGSPVTGESDASVNFALLLAMLSLMSLTGVYAKNKAKRY